MSLESRIRNLEQILYTLQVSHSLALAERQEAKARPTIQRQDTKERIKPIFSQISSFANNTGKGLLLIDNTQALYFEQLAFFAELKDLLDALQEFFALNFACNIPQNAPPPWGAQGVQIAQKIREVSQKLKKALP